MDPIKGGHKSGTAPTCEPTSSSSTSPNASADLDLDEEVERETRGVAQEGDLVVQASPNPSLSPGVARFFAD